MPYQILLGERAHLIEFPSILLPPGATTGSIVSIAVHQNHTEEKRRENEFWALQDEILNSYGKSSPEPPKLSVRIYFAFEKAPVLISCSFRSATSPKPQSPWNGQLLN